MAPSLYDLSVPTFLQTVRAMAGFLDRATAHCAETGADPDDFVVDRLYPDMAPFHFQIEALERGRMSASHPVPAAWRRTNSGAYHANPWK